MKMLALLLLAPLAWTAKWHRDSNNITVAKNIQAQQANLNLNSDSTSFIVESSPHTVMYPVQYCYLSPSNYLATLLEKPSLSVTGKGVATRATVNYNINSHLANAIKAARSKVPPDPVFLRVQLVCER